MNISENLESSKKHTWRIWTAIAWFPSYRSSPMPSKTSEPSLLLLCTKTIKILLLFSNPPFYEYISASRNSICSKNHPFPFFLFPSFAFWKVYSLSDVESPPFIRMQPNRSHFPPKNILLAFFECMCLSETNRQPEFPCKTIKQKIKQNKNMG